MSAAATITVPYAAEIEASLERLGEHGDPAPAVYARLFQRHPEFEAHFWRDSDGAVRGEMLARTLLALLDYIGPRAYADHLFATEMMTHEGYDVPRGVFITFLDTIRDTARDLLGAEWTEGMDRAWTQMLDELYGVVGLARSTEPETSVAAAISSWA
jgi:hemoglobin-like flavoprotein